MFKHLLVGLSFLMLGAVLAIGQTDTGTQSGSGTTQQQSGTQQPGTQSDSQSDTQSGSAPMQDNRELGRSEYGDDNSRTNQGASSSSTTTTETQSQSSSQEQNQSEQNQQLPRTASNMPLFVLVGLMLIGAGFMMRTIRAIRSGR